MIGLDGYVGSKKSFVGVDWLQLTSQGLKAAGGVAESQAKPGAAGQTKPEAPKPQPAKSYFWWWVGGILVVVVGGGYLLLRKKHHRR